MWRAVGIMIVGMCCIPLGDTAGKLMTAGGVSPFFVAWTRFALAGVLLAPFVDWSEARVLRDPRIWLRAAIIAAAISSILTALKTEPIANVFGAFFIGPIVSFTLSAIFLRETATPARAALLIVGFLGVILVVQPGQDMRPGLLFAVLAGGLYGTFLTTSRWLANVAQPTMLLFSQLAIPTLLLAPLGLANIPVMTPQIGVLVTVSSLGSMAGNLLLILAMRMAESTRLAPFVYFQIVAATVFGVVVFDTIPDPLAMAGITLLVLSGFASLALPSPRSPDRRG
ncbi:MAG: DMT family transporter [Pseudomonadota bacterium]